MLYFAALLAEFIYHDITYEDRMSEYFTLRDNKDNYSSDQDDNKVALFGIEFGVLVLILIDYFLHIIGYGLLFISRPQTILTIILLLGNLSLLVVFGIDK